MMAAVVSGVTHTAWGLDLSVPHVNGDDSRLLLGDGTGVIVGVIDSGVDDTHPGLAGVDSLGNPRMVAEGNFVPTEPANTGDDVAGHGTWVASVVLGKDPDNVYLGMATDARFINARVLNSGNSFSTTSWVENGIGFAVDNGAHVLNLSLNTSATFNQGTLDMDQMLDWVAEHRGVVAAVCNGNISQSQSGDPNTRAPGGAFNVLSVGRTDADFDQVHSGSSVGPTDDNRSKPDLVAPGTSITMANDDWETQTDWTSASGCSFATPHVAGLLAQQIDYGMTHGLSTSPLVTKATVLNSSSKEVLDKDGNDWEPSGSAVVDDVLTVTAPLNYHSGAGQIDGLSLYEQYSPGQQGPGLVDPVAWDLGAVSEGERVDYTIDGIVPAGVPLTATLTWFRHMNRTDLGDPGLDAADSFSLAELVDDLSLEVYHNGTLIAESISTVDNLEHLSLVTTAAGQYTLSVFGADLFGAPSEAFGLAWSTTIPEPTTLVAMLMAAVPAIQLRRRRA